MSPDFSTFSHNSAPPERISLDEVAIRKSKRIRKATRHFGELASEPEVGDKIGVPRSSYSASFKPEQVLNIRPMIESSVQLCPLEDNNSESEDDEDDIQEYEVGISGRELGPEDLLINKTG